MLKKKHFICLEGQRRWFILARPYVATDYFSVRLDGLSVFIPFFKMRKSCSLRTSCWFFCVLRPAHSLIIIGPAAEAAPEFRWSKQLLAHNTSLLLCSSGVGAISDFFQQQQQPLVIKLVRWNLKLMTVYMYRVSISLQYIE